VTQREDLLELVDEHEHALAGGTVRECQLDSEVQRAKVDPCPRAQEMR